MLRMLDLGGNALAAPDVHRQRLPQFLKALDDAVKYLDEKCRSTSPTAPSSPPSWSRPPAPSSSRASALVDLALSGQVPFAVRLKRHPSGSLARRRVPYIVPLMSVAGSRGTAALLLHARAYAVHTCRGLHQLDGRVVALDELTPTRASTPPPPTVSKLRAWRCRCVYLYNFLLVVHTTDSLSFRHLQVKCAALESALEVEERISAQQEEGGAAEAAARIAAEARVTSLCRCVLYR